MFAPLSKLHPHFKHLTQSSASPCGQTFRRRRLPSTVLGLGQSCINSQLLFHYGPLRPEWGEYKEATDLVRPILSRVDWRRGGQLLLHVVAALLHVWITARGIEGRGLWVVKSVYGEGGSNFALFCGVGKVFSERGVAGSGDFKFTQFTCRHVLGKACIERRVL